MIGIGISTYNDFANTNALINSIRRHTPGDDYVIVVVDDGTKDERIINALKKVCDSHKAVFSRNTVNRGIPYTWNRLVELCAIDPNDIAILFNNDILVTDGNWLKCIEYFLTKNEKIGTAGFPLIYPQDEKRTEKERSWGDTPGHVGVSVGCCFGFKKEVWQKVENPDGSTGFWENLVSFHEETHFGFMLSSMGYYNYQLPYPPMVHYGGQTFHKNRELTERVIDWNAMDRQLDMDQYVDTVRKSTVYPNEWKKEKVVWFNKDNDCVVDRMAFSRYMFAKHWNVLSDYDAPQVPVHKKIVTPMPKRRVKWLDQDLKEQEAMV